MPIDVSRPIIDIPAPFWNVELAALQFILGIFDGIKRPGCVP